MELTLMAEPSETILSELYGWGEVPFDWIAERGADFNKALLGNGENPYCMTSVYKGKEECSYSHIFMFPAEPSSQQLDINKQQRALMENLCRGKFRIHHIHAGVECFAFM
ncbi:hypothetical protein pEaSNUABM37_00352 [Erwinia phage pEa_SNUABM_37]|nr:hypothetical protein pEaSNUABM37_00352 [Erwinia phage pEa_SNUABM_37]QXO10820.1 hypothetical protein pEaSNUABM48_00352 [Erwinia phage pEa_SNUABM_48]